MKIIKYLPCLAIAILFITACSKSEEQQRNDCEFKEELCTIVPFCSWPPSPNADIGLPIAFQYNGDFVSHEEYNFLWSSDPEFGAGAISIRYEDLPVSVVVTEIATGCVVEVSLSAS